MKQWTIQDKPAFLLSVAAVIIAGLSLYGTCRAGGFETTEYRTTLRTELIPAIQGYQSGQKEPANYVGVTITNLHRYDSAVINDIGGVISKTGDCSYSTRIFKIIPEETEFPIILEPGHIAGPNQLELVVQIPKSLSFPETAYGDSPRDTDGRGWELSYICFRTADVEPIKHPIVGPVAPLLTPPEKLRESRKEKHPNK